MFNGTTTTHTYGSDGLRRRTVKGADTTDYIFDGDSVIRTLQNGVLDKTYFHGLRGPEYERTGAGNPTWYVYDGLGSVVGLLDVNGSLISTRKYDVYGSVRGGTGISGSKHKFVGSLGHPSEDDAGLIYMRARWMDPTTGTFASEDPARDGENWYSYSSQSPATHVDPSGKNSMNFFGEEDRFNAAAWQFRISLIESPQFRMVAAAFLLLWTGWVSYFGSCQAIELGLLTKNSLRVSTLWTVFNETALEKPSSMSVSAQIRAFHEGYAACLEISLIIIDSYGYEGVPF